MVVATVVAATAVAATAVDTVAVEDMVGSRAGPNRFVMGPCIVELVHFARCVGVLRVIHTARYFAVAAGVMGEEAAPHGILLAAVCCDELGSSLPYIAKLPVNVVGDVSTIRD